MFLVDTNVISAAAATRTEPRARLLDWMDRNSDQLFLSAITVAEIQDGIARAGRTGAHRKAARLEEWLETLLHLYSARILPLDIAVARIVGRLSDLARSHGHDPGFADLAIAATAQHHGHIVLTRNLRHFQAIGVASHNPFTSLPIDGETACLPAAGWPSPPG